MPRERKCLTSSNFFNSLKMCPYFYSVGKITYNVFTHQFASVKIIKSKIFSLEEIVKIIRDIENNATKKVAKYVQTPSSTVNIILNNGKR